MRLWKVLEKFVVCACMKSTWSEGFVFVKYGSRIMRILIRWSVLSCSLESSRIAIY